MATRSTAFRPEREPFRNDDALQLKRSKVSGPFSFLNPTQAHFDHVPSAKSSTLLDGSDSVTPGKEKPDLSAKFPASGVEHKWTSRNNRKGRHALVVKPASAADATYSTPQPTTGVKAVLKGIWRMCVYYPVWDVSYLVATVFTWGSVIWVINAMFSFLPYTDPSTDFSTEVYYGGGITAFIGATVFEIGSILLMVEAINENRAGCFGWAVEQVYEEHFGHERAIMRVVPEKDGCSHHHRNKKNLVGTSSSAAISKAAEKGKADSKSAPQGADSWIWWPSAHDLRTHYLHDIGFIACSAQTFGATVFWISGFTALPGIYNQLDTPAKLNGAYWVPQVIGGVGFVVSGVLFMIETQKHWWQPAPRVLGWHIGMWNFIGGIGFALCPIFGFGTAYWRGYQAACSTFWGSWAFLIGSALQWYESLEKNPVEVAKDS